MKRPILLAISLLISSLHWSGVPKAPDIVVGEYSHISGTNERPKSVFQPLACNNMIAMNDTILTAVRKHRDSAFKTCLTCQGSSCSFRVFQDRKTEAVCQRLFCTPIFVSPGFETPADTPSGKSSFTYSYDISKEGSLKNIAIIKAEGVFSKNLSLIHI